MDKDKTNKWEKFAQDQANQSVEADADADVSVDEAELNDEATLVDNTVSEEDEALATAAVFELQNTIKTMELKLSDAEDKTKRALAEAENARRRAEKDVSDAHRYGTKKILTEMLPVLDSLVRSREGVDDSDEKVKSILDGVGLTLDLFENTLAKFGFVAIDPERGDVFDPQRHEAMSMVPDADLEKNHVVNVLQKGYELNGRVIRAAMVMVSQ